MTRRRSFFAPRPRFRSPRLDVFVVGALATVVFFPSVFANDAPKSAPASNETSAVATPSDVQTAPTPGSAFRFWMAPADKIDRWPWGDEKYYPIRVETFNDWLATTADADASRSNDRSQVVVSSLSLDAKFENDALEGTGTIALSLVDDGSEPLDSALLPDFSAAASSFVKLGDAPDAGSLSAENAPNGAAPEGEEAFVGLYPDSRLYLANPENGAYSFRWSRRGAADAFGAVSFDLVFPASPRVEMRLETPSDAVVSVSNGVVEAVEPADRTSADASPTSQDDSATDETNRRPTTRVWRVFLGGESQTRLTVARSTPTLDARRRIGYRQETSRNLSLEGAEVVSRFFFDRSTLPLDDPTLVLEAPLVPISIEWNGVKDDAAVVARSTDNFGTKIKLRTPARRDQETLGELRVVAFSPLELDVDRRLPSVRLESDALFWRETLCRLTVVRPLLAASTTPIDAVQARDPLRARQEGQDFFAFKFFKPDAGVVVSLRTLRPSTAFDSATDCLVANDEISAKTTLFVRFDRQDASRLAVPIRSDWEIDAVQTPGDEPLGWSREDRGGRSTLVLSFPTAPPSDRPTRVSIAARRAETFDRQIEVDALSPLDLSNELRGAHALSLRAESSTQIELTTRSGRPFVPSKTTPKFVFNESLPRETLPTTGTGIRLYLGDQTADAVATLRRQRSTYAAELSGVGALDATVFSTAWTLRCVPSPGSRVDRVVFFASREAERTVAEESPWTWATAAEPNRPFVAAPLSDAEAKAFDVPPGVAAFEIRLATSRSVPFELRLFKNQPTTETVEAPLVFLPEAAIENAEFVVESPTGLPFWPRAQSLEATLAPPPPDDEFESLREAFRYAPTPNAETPRLSLDLAPRRDEGAETTAETLGPLAWRWFEKYDAFYETNGTIRVRAAFYLENRGRSSLTLRAPNGFDSTATNAVWVDARRVPWTLETLPDGGKAIRIALPPRRRFVCVEIERRVDGKPLFGRRRLTPTTFDCDAPALGGAWNVWIPPEFQTCERSGFFDDERGAALRSFLALFSFGDSRSRRVEVAAERFLRRFGDETALRRALADGRDDADGEIATPTWGDVFGTAPLVENLFAPNAEPSDDDPSKTADAIATPFGPLDATREPIRLYVDRFALAQARITPTTPLALGSVPNADAVSVPKKIALKTLENARVVLLFVDADLAVLTSSDVLANFAPQALETVDDDASIRRVKKADAARRFRALLLAETSPRFVPATAWPQTNDAAPVWLTRPGEESAPGWIRATVPLDQAADEGVWIVERYWLAALEWFSLVGVVVATWKRRFARPPFFVGVLGAAIAVQCAAPLEIALAARGAAVGTVCAFGFYTLGFLAPSTSGTRRDPAARTPLADDESRSSASESVSRVDDGSLVATNARVLRERRREPVEDASDESTQGFVDLSKLPFATRGRLEGPSDAPVSPPYRRDATSETPDFDDESTETRPDAPSSPSFPPSEPRRQGTTLMQTTTALAALSLALLFGATTLADAPTPPTAPADATGPLAPTASTPPSDAAPAWREPRRVFVPIDADKRPVGSYYWIPADFYEEIRSTLRTRPRERAWRVVDARYEGVVNYNAFVGATSFFNLKATYRVLLDSPSATLALPTTRLAPDVEAKFDRETIAPTFSPDGREIFFEIVGAEPGEHVLELTLAPPQFVDGENEISFPIPRVPSARLELTVPPDAPTLEFPNALGKTTRSSGRVLVELGPIDRLVVAQKEPNAKTGKASVDVEQLFLMRARSAQADVRASFRCQVVGGKIDSLVVDGDPLYAFSEHCQCDKAEIASVEPTTERGDALRVSFKTPISGSFVLGVDFVARDFSGVGRVRLPSISVRDARVSKSRLALVPDVGVECAELPPSNETVAAFQNAWGSPLDETPIAVYDLAETPSGASISTRLKSVRPVVSETTTLVVRPTRIETRVVATIDAPTDLFRLDLETPTPFAVDEIALFDEQNVAVETPEYFLESGALSLLFRTPLKGRRSLRIVGRSKAALDVARPFPTLAFQNVDFAEKILRLYRASNAYLDWTAPTVWTPLDPARLAEAETLDPAPRDDVFPVGAFDASPPTADADAARPAPIRPDDVVVRVNAPRLEGRQRVFLYRKTEESWKAAVDFRIAVRNGRVDQFRVAADESYALEPLGSDPNFVATETTLENGERALVFQPKTPFVGTAEFRFVATLENERENVRLPRFRLLPSSPREDVSNVARFAFLPQRVDATPIRWETSGLRAVERGGVPRTTLEEAAREMTRGTAALAAGGSPSESIATDELPPFVANDSGMTKVDFSIFEAFDDGDAWLASESDRLQISRVRHSFYVDARREIFGASTFSLRPDAPRSCVLLVPPSSRVLEATVNGTRRRVERLADGRWRIDLDATRFGKRLEIAFQIPASDFVRVERTLSRGRSTICELVAPRLEGAAAAETVWFCAFESLDDAGPRWRVAQRDVGSPESNAERSSAEVAPLRYSDANELLFRLGVGDENALLAELETDVALFANARADDFERRRVRWTRAWNRGELEISRFVFPDRNADALGATQRDAFLVVRAGSNEIGSSASVSSPLDAWTSARRREILNQKSKLETSRRFSNDEKTSANVASEVLWAIDQTLNARILAGWTDAPLDRLVVVAPSRRFDFAASRFATATFFLATTAIALRLLRAPARSRRFRRLLFGGLVGASALVFFALGWRTFGLAVVCVLAVVPPILEAASNRDATRRPVDAADDASKAPGSPRLEGETTETLAADAATPEKIR